MINMRETERDEEKTSGETRCSDGSERETNLRQDYNIDMINMRGSTSFIFYCKYDWIMYSKRNS